MSMNYRYHAIPDDPNYEFPKTIVQKGWDSNNDVYPIEYHTYESINPFGPWVKGQRPDSLMLMLLNNECLNSFSYWSNSEYTDLHVLDNIDCFVQLHIELHCVQFLYIFYREGDNYYLAHVYIAEA